MLSEPKTAINDLTDSRYPMHYKTCCTLCANISDCYDKPGPYVKYLRSVTQQQILIKSKETWNNNEKPTIVLIKRELLS